MAWPPPLLPTNLSNATAQQDTHPAVHNAANLAINDLVAETRRTKAWNVQSSVPSGPYGNTPVQIPMLQLTVLFEGGKLYRITAHVPNVRAIDNTQANLSITIAGAVTQTSNQIMEADSDTTMESSVMYGGPGTTQTVNAMMASTATTMAAIFIDGNATHKNFLLIEEISSP
jgi:hypothetical protein